MLAACRVLLQQETMSPSESDTELPTIRAVLPSMMGRGSVKECPLLPPASNFAVGSKGGGMVCRLLPLSPRPFCHHGAGACVANETVFSSKALLTCRAHQPSLPPHRPLSRGGGHLAGEKIHHLFILGKKGKGKGIVPPSSRRLDGSAEEFLKLLPVVSLSSLGQCLVTVLDDEGLEPQEADQAETSPATGRTPCRSKCSPFPSYI